MGIDWGQIVQGELSSISSAQQQQALQNTLQTVLNAINATLSQVNVTNTLLQNGTYGLAALEALLTALTGDLATDATAILTQIGTRQASGSPVTLPGSAPGGWSLPTTSDVGSLVWAQTITPAGASANDTLELIYYFVRNVDTGGSVSIPGSPYFILTGWANSDLTNFNPALAPQPDVGAILPTDTLLTWLTRELAGWTISTGYWGGNEIAVSGGSGSSLTYTCVLDDNSFALLQGARVPPAALPPVWPGLSGVTLGTPVALDSVLTVSVPCDGCLIHITGAPTKQGQFVFGDLVSYRNAGGLSFVNDDGEAEFPQLLGFTDAVYCPRSMAHASGLVLRASPGVTGTVTPWTLS